MIKSTLLLLLVALPLITFSQESIKKREADYPDNIWEIKQYKRAKDLYSNKDTTGVSNMEWARWEQWERLQSSNSRSTSLGNWQNFGPDTGSGRIISIAFHPTDSNTFYVGAASGGLWRTNDYGNTWHPLTDAYPSMAIGAIGINPLNPSKMIIATGEGYIAIGSEMTYGIGILISNDAGLTWNTTNVTTNLGAVFAGLDIYWSKNDTSNVCVATTWGILYSNDGGENYTSTLEVVPSRMVSDPQSPDTLYLTARYFNNNFLGGFYRSYDGGMTWTELLGTGLPDGTQMGFTSIDVNPTFPNIIYVNVSASTSIGVGPSLGLFKSNDYGNTFTLAPTNDDLLCYTALSYTYCLGWYANTLLSSQTDSSTLYAGGVRLWKTIDGGSNWIMIDTLADGSSNVHSDHHQTVFHPITGDLFDCHDGGVSFSSDQGLNWHSISDGLITYQYYSIAVSELAPEIVVGGTQDMGITYSTNVHAPNTWNYLIYGDVFSSIISHTNPAVWYTTVYPVGGRMKTFNYGVNWWIIEGGITNGEQWRTSLAMHPANPSVLLTSSSDSIYKTTDGTTWEAKGNIGNVSKIAYDKVNPNIIYANTMFAGDIHISINGGESWSTLVSSPGSPITDLETSPDTSGVLYATIGSFVNLNQLYVSTDFGVSWTNISNNLPNVPANSVVIDPFNTQNIYVGTDLGVWFSDNGGSNWEGFNHNLPYVAVEDMHYLKADTTLRIGTYGRGYWESKAINPNTVTRFETRKITQTQLVVFPNPTNDIVHFSGIAYNNKMKVLLYDLLGNEIENFTSANQTIDVVNLRNGIYILKISSDRHIWTTRIVKH